MQGECRVGSHPYVVGGVRGQSPWDRARAVKGNGITGGVAVGVLGGDGFPGGIHAADSGGAVGFGCCDAQTLDARTVLIDRVASAYQRAGIVDFVNQVVAARQATAIGGEQASFG